MLLNCGVGEDSWESSARRSNQSILNEVSPGISLEGVMLKLKLQYFGQLMRRADSFKKTLILGQIKGRRRRGQQRMRFWMASPTQWTWVLVNSRSWWWIGRPGVLPFMGSQWVGHDWATELNWIPPNDYEESWKLFTLSPYYSNLSLFSELLGVIWQKMVVPVKKIKMTLHDKSGGVLTTTT